MPDDPPPPRVLQCGTCPDPHPGDKQIRPCALDCRTVWWTWDDLADPDLYSEAAKLIEAERARIAELKAARPTRGRKRA